MGSRGSLAMAITSLVLFLLGMVTLFVGSSNSWLLLVAPAILSAYWFRDFRLARRAERRGRLARRAAPPA